MISHTQSGFPSRSHLARRFRSRPGPPVKAGGREHFLSFPPLHRWRSCAMVFSRFQEASPVQPGFRMFSKKQQLSRRVSSSRPVSPRLDRFRKVAGGETLFFLEIELCLYQA